MVSEVWRISSIYKVLMIPIELAHQWFGNLVTMDWWDELWLKEGFATWVGWLAVDHFYPGKSRSLNRSSSYS
jgi:aminopeptidase N